MNNTIELKNLTKSFRTESEEILLFENLDLSIPQGQSVIITGASGSGKSTFLNLVSGLDHPTGGDIAIYGQTITSMGEEQLARFRLDHIGLVFQFHHLLKDFTALENIAIPGLLKGLSKKEARKRALESIEMVNMSSRKDHYPSKLSGGERQRIAIARALFNNPSLILADEPTGNLDAKNSRYVEEIFFDLVKTLGKTLILVTHDTTLVPHGDKHLCLAEGELKEG